jgi:acyl-CoA hydrolase
MITFDTAVSIVRAYQEIQASEKLIAEISEGLKNDELPDFRDAFGRRRNLQLGVPSSESSTRIYDVHPKLALAVVHAHMAEKKAILSALNEVAKGEAA